MRLPEVVDVQSDRSLVLYGAPWPLYEAFLNAYEEQPSRISYDEGVLEVPMVLSIEHERLSFFLGSLIDRISEVFDIQMACGGSSTLKLELKQKGLEADQCFWIEHADAIHDALRLDLTIHPPPDLVVEIDITHAVIDREAIYASLGVTEMWHYEKSTKLTGWINRDGTWERIDKSYSFPMIRISDVSLFVERLRAGEKEVTLKRDFRKWLEELKASIKHPE